MACGRWPRNSKLSPPAHSRRTSIWLRVSVPVLSTHRTVVAPSSSTAGMLRVSTFCLDRRHAPSPRKMVSTTGNSSGRMAIASVSPASKPVSQSPRVRPHPSANAAAIASPTTATRLTTSEVSRWMGVSPTVMPPSEAPMRPRALRAPVATTRHCAVPWVTRVPAKQRLADGSEGKAPACGACLRTGTDSPVRSDSSTLR